MRLGLGEFGTSDIMHQAGYLEETGKIRSDPRSETGGEILFLPPLSPPIAIDGRTDRTLQGILWGFLGGCQFPVKPLVMVRAGATVLIYQPNDIDFFICGISWYQHSAPRKDRPKLCR
jgi:hypothetical protein